MVTGADQPVGQALVITDAHRHLIGAGDLILVPSRFEPCGLTQMYGLRYAHQGGQNPPVIVVHGSSLDKVGDSYRRFLEGWFRERLALQGTPLRIEFRTGANPYANRGK